MTVALIFAHMVDNGEWRAIPATVITAFIAVYYMHRIYRAKEDR